MSELRDRLKEVRQTATGNKLTQTEFADAIGGGVTRAMIASYEGGAVVPAGYFLDRVADIFHVNKEWLKTGEGSPYTEDKRTNDISNWLGRVLADDTASFQRQFATVLSQLNTEQWEVLAGIAKKMYEEHEKADQ